MTIPEFLAELKLCVPRAAWSVKHDGALRARYTADRAEFCPLTALAWWRDSEHFATTIEFDAAQYLGIADSDASAIMYAADDMTGSSPTLRADLLAATIDKR